MMCDQNIYSQERFHISLGPLPADERIAFVDRACFHARNGRFGPPLVSSLRAYVDHPRPVITTATLDGFWPKSLIGNIDHEVLDQTLNLHFSPQDSGCYSLSPNSRHFFTRSRIDGRPPPSNVSPTDFLGLIPYESQNLTACNSPPTAH